jgi:hypothetical protein
MGFVYQKYPAEAFIAKLCGYLCRKGNEQILLKKLKKSKKDDNCVKRLV